MSLSSLSSKLTPALRLAAKRNLHCAAPTFARATLPARATSSSCSYSLSPVLSALAHPIRANPIPKPRTPAFDSTDIVGTVNDPTVFPAPNKAHGAYHWSFERFLSAALVPLVGATAVTSVNPVLDGVLAVALVVHTHIGFDCILTDYLHPRKFPVAGNIAKWLLRFATGGVLVGVYQFNTNDVGLTELVKRFWHA